MGVFDLEKHFAFYGAYHSNPINVLIHLLVVWPNFFTLLVLFYFTPAIFDISRLGVIPPPLNDVLVLNLGFLFTMIHVVFYVCLDKKAGSLGALLCLASWVGSSFFAARLGYSLAWKVVLAAQALCWTGQSIGHGIFEKRAPAFLDNLPAFIMAPFFVLLEILQKVFHYEPYPGFRANVESKIGAEVQAWKASKAKATKVQ